MTRSRAHSESRASRHSALARRWLSQYKPPDAENIKYSDPLGKQSTLSESLGIVPLDSMSESELQETAMKFKDA